MGLPYDVHLRRDEIPRSGTAAPSLGVHHKCIEVYSSATQVYSDATWVYSSATRVYFVSTPDFASIPLRVYLLTSRVYVKSLEVYFMKHNLYSCNKRSIPATQVECQRAEDEKPVEAKKPKKVNKLPRDGVPRARSAPSLPLPHAVQDLPASANTKVCACPSACACGMWHKACDACTSSLSHPWCPRTAGSGGRPAGS